MEGRTSRQDREGKGRERGWDREGSDVKAVRGERECERREKEIWHDREESETGKKK